MATLLIRLVGPMQSWGTRSQFDDRDTEAEPSKSGVLGLCAAALGRDRAESVVDLAALQFGVRVDREGVVQQEFQTAQLVPGEPRTLTAVSHRAYLADAAFWAALEGDVGLLRLLQTALKNPYWPLSLGRKSYLPSQPVWLKGGVLDGRLLEMLRRAPSLRRAADAPAVGLGAGRIAGPYRFVVDRDGVDGDASRFSPSVRRDQPLGPFADRRYALRDVLMFTGEGPHGAA